MASGINARVIEGDDGASSFVVSFLPMKSLGALTDPQ